MLSQPFSPRKAADSLIMASCRSTAFAFAMMQSQKLLSLHSRSFLGHSSDVVATIFTKKDGR